MRRMKIWRAEARYLEVIIAAFVACPPPRTSSAGFGHQAPFDMYMSIIWYHARMKKKTQAKVRSNPMRHAVVHPGYFPKQEERKQKAPSSVVHHTPSNHLCVGPMRHIGKPGSKPEPERAERIGKEVPTSVCISEVLGTKLATKPWGLDSGVRYLHSSTTWSARSPVAPPGSSRTTRAPRYHPPRRRPRAY